MKKNWKIIISLILALIVIVFAMLNMETATINFGFAQVKQPLIILIVSSTLIGALIVALLSSGSLISKNREIKALQKELDKEKEDVQHRIDEAVAQEKESLMNAVESDEQNAESTVSETK